MFQDLKAAFHRYNSFLITTHVNPDGDAIGSQIACCNYLTSLGKTCYIINDSYLPDDLCFLDPDNIILRFVSDYTYDWLHEIEAVVILDVGDFSRLGGVAGLVELTGKPKIVVDHHQKNKQNGDLELIDPSACSTGIILYDYFNYAGHALSPHTCVALYASILTDTGGFSYSNACPAAHIAAADLIEKGGFDPSSIYDKIYKNYKLPRFKLMGEFLQQLTLECGGRLAWSFITPEMLKKSNTAMHDTEGFCDIPFDMSHVYMSLLFKELGPETTKVSLRARGDYNVFDLATKFDGGGHKHAAGILMHAPRQEVQQHVLDKAIEYIENMP